MKAPKRLEIEEDPQVYIFGPFRLELREGLLFENDEPVPLAPKAFDTLRVLVQHHGHVLSKEDLIAQVWPDSFVEENNLSQNISQLRKALGESRGRTYIETISKRGYRFVAPVEAGPAARAAYASPVLGQKGGFRPPETRYASSGDVNIAYQVLGEGPIDLVFVMGWVSHLEYFWSEPSFARFLRRLASFSRLILFDKRGTGLSDRVPVNALPTLEQRMDDVRAVMSEVGSRRALLCGVSEGGVMSALFAATYPERTSGLITIGAYAKRLRDDTYPWGMTDDQHEAFLSEIQHQWGGPVGLELRAPTRASDPDFRLWWSTYLRMGASPGAAVALTRMNAEIDARNVLPTIRVPSLVIHRSGDRCLKVEEGRYLASLIPGARYVELAGDDHLPFVGGQDELFAEIERFVLDLSNQPAPELVLSTILFIAAPGGADADMTPSLQAQFHREVEWFRGLEIQRYGAAFDGPARAIRCAANFLVAARLAGTKLSAALHTGECVRSANSLSGFAVDVAGRMVAAAPPGAILVSHTVRDLVAGSGITFQDAGQLAWEESPGELRLSLVTSV